MVSLRTSGLYITVAIVGIISIIGFLRYAADDVGLDAELETDLIAILPGLVVSSMGILLIPIAMADKRFLVVPACGVTGIGIAVLLGEMNTTGMVVDKWVTDGFALIGLQGFFIVISIITGAFLTVRRRS